MSETSIPGFPSLGVANRQAGGGSASSVATPSQTPVPAAAAAPVWQPWVETHSQAQSRLKTQIGAASAEFNRDMADAQRILDVAESIAQTQVRQLEIAAWAAWHKYQEQANAIHEAVMNPALAAYQNAVDQAHARANTLIYRAQQAYDQAKHISIYGRDTATGSDTF